MPTTLATAKIYVARTIGGQNDLDQLAAAGDAIKEAIEDWNLRRNWNYLLMDNSDAPIDIVAGTHTYDLQSTVKDQYTARLMSKTRTLQWVDMRHYDQIVRDVTQQSIPSHYTIFNASTAFNASAVSTQVGRVRLLPTPSYTQNDELLVRYYRLIESPSTDFTYIDVPDRYLFALLARSKYYFMVNKDAESARTVHHDQISHELYKKCETEDEGYEDREVVLKPQTSYGQAFGPMIHGYPDEFWVP